MIKIRYDKHLGTGGDCVSAYTAHFESNPLLMEFVDWIKEQKGDFGTIDMKAPYHSIEYKHGEIINNTFPLNDFTRTIELIRISGGYSMMDYLIRFVN